MVIPGIRTHLCRINQAYPGQHLGVFCKTASTFCKNPIEYYKNAFAYCKNAIRFCKDVIESCKDVYTFPTDEDKVRRNRNRLKKDAALFWHTGPFVKHLDNP